MAIHSFIQGAVSLRIPSEFCHVESVVISLDQIRLRSAAHASNNPFNFYYRLTQLSPPTTWCSKDV